ncbi:cation transporter [Tropicimonas sp. S265A]|uniref:cation transporter n=1 Tax=Tropicimonas sp. S265A TaxID=3415134 RepID=UPI003C7AF6D0
MKMFAVPEMYCPKCSGSIRTALTALDPAAKIEANVELRYVRLETEASDAQVLMALNEIGFAANVRS